MQFVVQSGPEPGKTYDLDTNGQLSVGRQSANDIIISDEQVSRRHAEIKATAGGALVTDLGSSNGTYVNGARVSSPQVIKPNDTLQIGTTVLRLVDNDNATSTMPAGYDPPAPTAIGNYGGNSSYDNSSYQAAGSAPIAQSQYQASTPPATPSLPMSDSYNPGGGYGQAAAYNPNAAGGNYGQTPASYDPNAGGGYNPNAYQPQAYQPQAVNPGYAAPVAQPQVVAAPARRKLPLPLPALIAIAAVIALLVIGGILFTVLSGGGSGSGLPKPNNATKLDVSTDDFKNILGASGSTQVKNVDLSKVKIDAYSTKESLDSLASFYKDQMGKNGWTFDSAKSTAENLYFKKGDEVGEVSLTTIKDDATLTSYKLVFPKAKDQMHVGDNLVALLDGPSSVVQSLNGSVPLRDAA